MKKNQKEKKQKYNSNIFGGKCNGKIKNSKQNNYYEYKIRR